MESFDEIQQKYERSIARVTELYYGSLEDIKENRDLSEEDRSRSAWGAHAAAVEALGQATSQRNLALEGREQVLQRKLFKGPDVRYNETGNAAYAQALTQAALADDATLERLARVAEQTENAILGRAVFSVAHERGRGDLVSAYLTNHEADAEVFEELSSIPDEAARERALEGVERAIPEPTSQQVTPRAHVGDTPEPAARPLAG